MLDNMIAQFKTLEDLQAFANAQQKTLQKLIKEKKNLEDENTHLKKLVEGVVPVISSPKIDFSSNDEENIAREQLFRLKEVSTLRELSYEETKKLEIYSKILNSLKGKLKDINGNGKDLTEAQLLSLVKNTNE